MSELKVAGFGRSGGKKTTLSDQEDFSNGIDWSNSSEANRSDKYLGKLKMTHIPKPPLLTRTWSCQLSTAVPAAAWPKGLCQGGTETAPQDSQRLEVRPGAIPWTGTHKYSSLRLTSARGSGEAASEQALGL